MPHTTPHAPRGASAPLVDPAFTPALVPSAAICTSLLQDFARAMRRHGYNPLLQRMCYDRRYAFDHLSKAHETSDDHLRELATDLFAQY